MPLLHERIRRLRRERQLTQQQIATAFGINKASVAEWESGRTAPANERLGQLAELLGTTVDYLLRGSEGADSFGHSETGDAYISVRHARFKLAAGTSGYVVEYDNADGGPLYFRADWLQKRSLKADRLIALKVYGASMEPGLFDGDTVVVNLADASPADGVVFAVNYEGECVVKRLKRDAGRWWLASDNQDKRFFPDKLCDENVQIIGRIVHRQSEHI